MGWDEPGGLSVPDGDRHARNVLRPVEVDMPGSATRANALDHVVVVLFENRSLDNVLGRLYGPEDGKSFDGGIGKDLSNPIPERAQPGAGRKGRRSRAETPTPDVTPPMDGFVADYISPFTAEMGRQPTYEEYAHIMTGYTPEQLPVLNGIARDLGVFD